MQPQQVEVVGPQRAKARVLELVYLVATTKCSRSAAIRSASTRSEAWSSASISSP
jgi:hypothetical protein